MNNKYKDEKEKDKLLEKVGAIERGDIFDCYLNKVNKKIGRKIKHLYDIPLKELQKYFKQKVLYSLK